ncbi:hypothetical protein N865_14170 [Intrasporangium oryzae NRRL B-24470]|uniref:Carboxylesterase n=1 Tax=Intrasporangium oryzae NRRL B-24470 TaxID=1386089 RepID=W9G768_9MICO|nr:DUF1214 domain-containing protein [Intrasporangium oryzae]EWT00668.1 hypothetical protein N865_14170 [Intrasporangium oryzae NRRL B-24470]
MSLLVNVDNFVRAETARMLTDIQRDAGGVNRLRHSREPAPIDDQTVIRLNRDTLYSFTVVDLTTPAELVLPPTDGRYLSAMIVNEDHHVPQVLHGPGSFRLTAEEAGSAHVLVAVRVLVDPNDPADLAQAAAIQDGITLTASSNEPFQGPDYDPTSLDETRAALLSLARNLTGFDRMFGSADEVEPVRHLIGTAAGWGGLPTSEAAYLGVDPKVGPGSYELTFRDVPVDAFWSVSVYNAAGFFEPNASGRYTLNSVTAVRDADGSVTVRFVPDDSVTGPNTIPVPGEGWNYLVRLYRPRPEVLDGSWTTPSITKSVAGQPD